MPQYIDGLDDRLVELQMVTACQPSRETMLLLSKKVRTLRGVVEAEKLKSASERLAAVQIMPPVSKSHGLEKTQEIFCQTRSKYNNQVREELFAGSKKGRSGENDEAVSRDADLVLEHNRGVQDTVAEGMVALAQNLKENLHITGGIIRQDTQALEGTSRRTEENMLSLRAKSQKLSDFARRSCQYWLWFALFGVFLSFLFMIFFMRTFPKKSYVS